MAAFADQWPKTIGWPSKEYTKANFLIKSFFGIAQSKDNVHAIKSK